MLLQIRHIFVVEDDDDEDKKAMMMMTRWFFFALLSIIQGNASVLVFLMVIM